MALHLVADGGNHFWIERSNRYRTRFTDEAKLRSKFGGSDSFKVLYDDEIWRAAIVQVGRFGVVYSAVLEVLPQYGLQEQLVRSDWESRARQDSRSLSRTSSSPLARERRLTDFSIAINPVPSMNGTTHLCGITKRSTLPLDHVQLSPMPPVAWGGGRNVAGRPERVGNIVVPFDPTQTRPDFRWPGSALLGRRMTAE